MKPPTTGGYIVGWMRLAAWAKERGISLAQKPDAEMWKQTLVDVEVGRKQQGKPFHGFPVKGQLLTHDVPEHEYMHLPRRRVIGSAYTLEEIYENLLEWDDELPDGAPRSQRAGQQWASGRPRTPSYDVLRKHGRLRQLLVQARRWRRAQQKATGKKAD